MTQPRKPNKATLEEFGLLRELLTEGSAALAGLQRVLPAGPPTIEEREDARRQRFLTRTPDEVGRGQGGVTFKPDAEWIEHDERSR